MNNLNLIKRTIIGGRLSSGGLDYHKFFYYDINDIYTKTNSSLSKNMPLNKLIAYLCLDELRTTYRDDQSFFNHLKNHDMPFEPKELMVAEAKRPLDISNSSFMDHTQRGKIYEMYKETRTRGKSMANMKSPIDSYNEAMEILQDFKEGNFNTGTTDKETITDNKAKRLLQGLRRACGSSPVVGSSRNSTVGLLTSVDAMAKRCFCPPESCST